MSQCRLFRAVQDTLPDSQKIKRIDSPKDAGEAVKFMLEQDKISKTPTNKGNKK